MSKSSPRPPQDPREVAEQVRQWIAAGKCKQAVELAKEHHKKQSTAESQALVVEAYLARIAQFQAKNQPVEAKTLIDLVRQRYPEHASKLSEATRVSAAVQGDAAALVAPLASDSTSAEEREAIGAEIRQRLLDLPALASAATLAPEHPLRVAASAAQRAFEAVTSGPVSDEAIALPEISRRSPLAGWRLLVRAIALLHRQTEAEACVRTLDAIEPETAVHPITELMRRILREEPPESRGAAGALWQRISRVDDTLASLLTRVAHHIRHGDGESIVRYSRRTLLECQRVEPRRMELLKQNLWVAIGSEHGGLSRIAAGLQLTSLEAWMWRSLAVAQERGGAPLSAGMCWERFYLHAVHEGLINPNSAEAGLILARAASNCERARHEAHADDGAFEDDYQDEFYGSLGIDALEDFFEFSELYAMMPPAIAALGPEDPEKHLEQLTPDSLHRRSVEAHADPRVFRRWVGEHRFGSSNDNAIVEICELWVRLLPNDPTPLTMLAVAAEGRGALKKALDYLAEAERLDATSKAVREARTRVTLATAHRHIQQHKPHLIEKDIEALAALPSMREGDRPGVLEAMKTIVAVLRRDEQAIEAGVEATRGLVGEQLGVTLIHALAMGGKMEPEYADYLPDWPQRKVSRPVEVASAWGRAAKVMALMGQFFPRPVWWVEVIRKVLTARPCELSDADLLWASEVETMPALAYLATVAGLERCEGVVAARFLISRALCLCALHEGRASQCFQAALALAGRAHDRELVDHIHRLIDKMPMVAWHMGSRRVIEDSTLQAILSAEHAANVWPETYAALEAAMVSIIDSSSMQAGEGWDFVEGDDDDDEDDDWDDEDDLDELEEVEVPEGSSARSLFEQFLADQSEKKPGATANDSRNSPVPMDKSWLETFGFDPELHRWYVDVVKRFGPDVTPEQMQSDSPEMHTEYKKMARQFMSSFQRFVDKLTSSGHWGGAGSKEKGRDKRRR